jgi:hypothetical protein
LLALTAPPGRPIPALKYGTVGWKALPVAAPWQQIGLYDQPIPTQYPVNIPGVQLRNGVEDLNSRLTQPAARGSAASWQRTQKPSYVTGPQLYGKSFSGQQGGILGAAQSNAVLAGQIAASGGATGQSNIVAAEHLMGSGAY